MQVKFTIISVCLKKNQKSQPGFVMHVCLEERSTIGNYLLHTHTFHSFPHFATSNFVTNEILSLFSFRSEKVKKQQIVYTIKIEEKKKVRKRRTKNSQLQTSDSDQVFGELRRSRHVWLL